MEPWRNALDELLGNTGTPSLSTPALRSSESIARASPPSILVQSSKKSAAEPSEGPRWLSDDPLTPSTDAPSSHPGSDWLGKLQHAIGALAEGEASSTDRAHALAARAASQDVRRLVEIWRQSAGLGAYAIGLALPQILTAITQGRDTQDDAAIRAAVRDGVDHAFQTAAMTPGSVESLAEATLAAAVSIPAARPFIADLVRRHRAALIADLATWTYLRTYG